MVCFQILVSFASLTGTTRGFLFDTKCPAPLPCTCRSDVIDCKSKQLSQVPVFSRHNEQYSPISLYLSNNQLTVIPAYAFTNLSTINATVITLYLRHNHISNIENHAFSGVENAVKVISLEYNNLTHLPLALTELSSLVYLNLLDNPLFKLDAPILANISRSLNSFSFSVDRFSRFPNELQLLTTLSTLTINGIKFPMVHSTVFHSFENSLTSLEMSHANFESIPAAVCKLKYLTSFKSDYSPNLSRYNSSIFDECNHMMTNVTSLKLRNDKLTTIPQLALIFPKLENLDIQLNEFHFIESRAIAGLTSLTYFNLGFNHFTHIPFAVNKAFNVQSLWVDGNQIETVEELDLFRLHNLTTLLLYRNPIVYLSPFAFTHNPLLNHIDMRFTNLMHIPKALLGLNNLRSVSLNAKPIECSCHDMSYLKSWNVTSINVDVTCSSGKSVKTYLTTDLPKCP